MADLLKKGLKGLSKKDQTSLLFDAFGTDSIKAAQILGEGGSKAVKDMYREFRQLWITYSRKTKSNISTIYRN